jgi:translin
MKELTRISNKILRNLNKKEQVREQALALTREIARGSTEIINDIHKHKDVKNKFQFQRKRVKKLNGLLKYYPDLLFRGFTLNALQEYAEASIFHAIIEKKQLPSPEDLEIDDIPYALGMGDVVGELRRIILNMLIENDLQSAKTYFRTMEKLTEILFTFNFPDGLISIRRKQDTARSLLEKTQGELAIALTTKGLKK